MKGQLSFYKICMMLSIIIQTQIQADSTPAMSSIYGDYFIPGVNQSQLLATVGTLDATFGMQGSVNLTYELSGGTARALQVLLDGTFLVALSKPNQNSVLVKYRSINNLDGLFGTFGTVYLDGSTAVAQTMILDTQGRSLIAGGDDTTSGTAGWLQRISTDGNTITSFATRASWQFIAGLAEQTTGQIIAVGSNNSYAQIGRYNVDGSLDRSFGTSGFITFNGLNLLPTVTAGLYSVVVDAQNLIYVTFLDNGNNAWVARFTPSGDLDTTFHDISAKMAIFVLNSATPSQMRIAINANNNLIVAAQVRKNIVVTGITTAATSITGFTNYVLTALNITYDLRSLITLADNTILLIGSNETAKKSRVTRLTGSGLLDTRFNNSLGYNEFSIGLPTTNSLLFGAAISPEGRLYVVGSQLDGGINSPYVSRLYNNIYITQVPQCPRAQEQGNLDLMFGISDAYDSGVVSPFNGIYGSILQQKAKSVIELASGNILIGMDGKTNTRAHATLMLASLTSQGDLDRTFNNGSGTKSLPSYDLDEYLNGIAEDLFENLYVFGYSNSGAILRQYTSVGTQSWVADNNIAGHQNIAVEFQSINRIIVSTQVTATTGQISGYNFSDGTIDTTFHSSGDTPGSILSTDFNLHMGPVFGIATNQIGHIVIAYKNNVTGYVDVAIIEKNGTSLVSQFASGKTIPGIYDNVFELTGSPVINSSNVRLTLDNDDNIVVAMVDDVGTGLQMIGLLSSTGAINSNFNNGLILDFVLYNSTSLSLSKIIGISDGSFVVTMRDHAVDDTMLVARITPAGTVDATFNSQGAQQGVLPLKIESNASHYTRVATDLMVQSSTGNLILAGYEQQTTRDATPMVMRIFGAAATTEVKNYQSPNESGTVDTTFATDGVLDLYTFLSVFRNSRTIESSPNLVYTYPADNSNAGKLLVAVDNGTTTFVGRAIVSDFSLDPTFGVAGVYKDLPNLRGMNSMTTDAEDNILIAGTYAGNGWIQRLTPDGLFDVACNVPVNLVTINQVYQQESGRYIAVGADSNGYGLVVAFQDELVAPATTLAVDTTFNPSGFAGDGVSKGIYQINRTTNGIHNLSINDDDTLVVIYKNATPVLEITKIKADGSGLVNSFNTGNLVATLIIPDSSSSCKLSIDNAGNIVVAASYNSGGISNLQVARYDGNGGITTAFTGTGVVDGVQTILNVGTAGVVLENFIQTPTQQSLLVGYNSAGGNGRLFVVNLDVDGSLYRLWNTLPIGTDTRGVLTSDIGINKQVDGSAISIDGDIYISALTTGDPIMVRITGNRYIIPVDQQPEEIVAGIIDTTLDTLTPGSNALNLDTAVSMMGSAKKIYMNQIDGSMLIASSDGAYSYVTKLNADLSLAGTYGSAPFGLSGVVTLHKANVSDLFVADGPGGDGSICVTGDTSGGASAMWAVKISSDGLHVSLLRQPTPVDGVTLSYGNVIRQTTNSRVLVGGKTITSGVIAAFSSDLSCMDTAFGNGADTGYYRTNVNSPIQDIVVDDLNKIYIAYVDTGLIKVARLVESGEILDAHFGVSGTVSIIPVSSVDAATKIRLSYDDEHQQLVVAFQDGVASNNMIHVVRYSTAPDSDGIISGVISAGITVTSDIVDLSDLCIDALQNIYVIGSCASNLGLVARIKSVDATTLSLDNAAPTLYGTAGVAAVNMGAMHNVHAGALSPDRRVYVVGDNGSTTAYMARLFGNVYSSELLKGVPQAVPGILDLTFGFSDNGAFELDSLSDQIGSAIPQALQLKSDGSMIIAMQTNVSDETLLVNIKNDLTLDDAGIIDIATGAPGVQSLTLDALEQILVAGHGDDVSWIARYDGSTGLPVGTFPSIPSMISVVGLLLQSQGRVILGGDQDTTHGVLVGLAPISFVDGNGTSTPIFDASFGADGRFTNPNINSMHSFAIDNNNRIVVGFVALDGITVSLARVRQHASGLDTNFHNTGLIATNITTAVGIKPVKVALDNDNKIVVATTTSTGISVRRYDDTGATEDVGLNITNSALALTAPVITQLLTTITNQIILLGYENINNGNMFAIRLTSDGLLDTTFNPAPASIPGILKYQIHTGDNVHRLYAGAIAQDGRIVAIGYEDVA